MLWTAPPPYRPGDLTWPWKSDEFEEEIRSAARPISFSGTDRSGNSCLLRLTPDNVDDYDFSGQEHFSSLVGKRHSFTGHLGNWELMALAFFFQIQEPRFHVMARDHDFEPMDRVMRGNPPLPFQERLRLVDKE